MNDLCQNWKLKPPKKNYFFSRRLQAVRNRDCWVFGNRWCRVWNTLVAWFDWPWHPYFATDLHRCM